MSTDETSVEGLSELATAMEGLTPRMARAAMRPALNAGGQVFLAALDATTPRGETGALAESEKSKVSVKGDNYSVLVGPTYQGGYKETSTDPGVRSKFVELGTRKMAPRFFMRRAFEASKEAAVSAATTVLKAVLENLPK